MRVFVYWNLHKNLWSVKALEGPDKGRVIARQPYVALVNASPKVSETGRQRVLREKRKNVHAGIVGELEHDAYRFRPWARRHNAITYNPYAGPSFYWRAYPDRDWTGSGMVYCERDRVVTATQW